MCGVVGYIGKELSRSVVLHGLEKLEYRGYDSAGFACIDTLQMLKISKMPGYLANLKQKLEVDPIDGHIGIGHIRWATHGDTSEINTHPQLDCFSRIAVVHNGVIENHLELRKELIAQGHKFSSSTDTEIIAHFCENFDIFSIVRRLCGAYACMIINQEDPDRLIAIRKGAPLCIGILDGQYFVASDPFAFAHFSNKVIFLPDESIAYICKNTLEIFDFDGNTLNLVVSTLDINTADHEKAGYEHYMLKEIYEQKSSIQATLASCYASTDKIWPQIGISRSDAVSLRSLCLIACGTSWHAGRIAQFFFEHIAKVSTRVLLASEFRYAPFFPDMADCYIAISRSGETADTLESVRLVNRHHKPTIALTDILQSTMVREARGYFLTKAGQEIAVASTKAFSTQLVALYWLAQRLALEKGIITQYQFDAMHDEILFVAEVLEMAIERNRQRIQEELAPFYAQFDRYIFLGRHISYPFAMEAALKLKEVSYIFSQCYPAGELKHGPIALLDPRTPVILFSNLDDQIYQKILLSAQQVKARHAHLLVFAFEDQDELISLADHTFVLARVNSLLAPLAMTGLMQIWVYEIARALQRPIDKPRNLAKAVTVE